MMVRRIARPLFAAMFVAEGLDAFRDPRPHAHRAEAAWRNLAARTGLPAAPSAGRVKVLVRAHGALMTLAALSLALGRAPRTAALMLAGLSVPLAVVNQPFGSSARQTTATEDTPDGGRGRLGRLTRPIGATGWVTGSVQAGGANHTARRDRFVKNLTMLGGALLAAADTEGRPGLGWRVQHARVDHAAAREAKQAVGAAAREARAAARSLTHRS